ncbi:hypothetical protein REPUB_Repub01dG0238000 [Reevesia pubescens]
MVEKGHFVMYSADEKRFVLPLEYLKNEIVMELFKLAEEEFGIPSNGHLTLPCDAAFMEYVIGLIKRKAILNKMINAKKLIKLAKKWQKLAAIRRKRITSSETLSFRDVGTNSCSTSSTVEKGHFVVCSADQKRFVLPL